MGVALFCQDKFAKAVITVVRAVLAHIFKPFIKKMKNIKNDNVSKSCQYKSFGFTKKNIFNTFCIALGKTTTDNIFKYYFYLDFSYYVL